MNMHENARLTPLGRERLVKQAISGQTPEAAARAAGVCPRTARTWLARFKAEGIAGLADRSSRPKKLRAPTPEDTAARIMALRRKRRTGKHIARETGVSPATVSRVLKRAGLSRLKDLEPAEPVRRYERKEPGELIHLDIKKLNRFHEIGHRITGWRVSRTAHASFVLDALEQALHDRRPVSGGSVGDSYDNALAETINGLYKAEVIWRRGPWKSMEAVEYATLEWIDRFNNRRLLEPIGNIPPAEAEAACFASFEEQAIAA